MMVPQERFQGGNVTKPKTKVTAQSLTRLERTLKVRYLGIGFLWAWVYGSFETFAVFPERAGIGINADSSWLASAVVVTLTLFVLGFVLGRRQTMAPPWLTVAAGVATAAGTLLSGLAAVEGILAPAVVSGALTGLGTGALYVLWGQALAALDIESSEVAIPAASLIMLGCALVLPYLPSTVGILATASLPLASGLMLLATYRDIPPVENASVATDGLRRPALFTLARIAALLFLSYFVIGCSGALQANADAPFIVWGIDIATVIGSICGIALVVGIVLFAARPSFDGLFRLIAPLVAIALALLPWADLWAVALSTSLVAIADTTLTIAAVLFVVTAAKSNGAKAALGIGVAEGSLQLGVLAGNLAGHALNEMTSIEPLGLFAIALGLLVVFSLSWLGYPTNRSSVLEISAAHNTAPRNEAVLPIGRIDKPDDPGEAGSITSSADTTIDGICQRLTEEHGLSGREAEILGYLARGRSQPYIREELVLSKNTVATHVKHIYQKLGVHSRQELLDLFE